MSGTFTNPANNYSEDIPDLAWLWQILFGIFYLMVLGLWVHVAAWFLLSALFGVMTGGPGGLVFSFLCWVIYPFTVKGILRKRYLQRGWVES